MSKKRKAVKSNKQKKYWCEDTFIFKNVSDDKASTMPTKKDDDIKIVMDRALHSIFITDKVKNVTMSRLYKVMWNYGYTRLEVDTHWDKNKDDSINEYLESDSVDLHEIIEVPEHFKAMKKAFTSDWKLKNISVAKARREKKEGVEGVQYTRAVQKLKRTYNDPTTSKETKEKLKKFWKDRGYFGNIEDK